MTPLGLYDRWILFWHGIAHMLMSIPFVLKLSFFLIIVILITFLISIRKAIKRNKKDDVSSHENIPLRVNEYKMPPIGGPISTYLVEKGKISVGEISSIFLKGVDFIKNTFQSRDSLYQLPWYLVLGAEQSGKSSLFNASEIHLPIGEPDLYKGQANPKLKWWFLDHGIFLEPRGDGILTFEGGFGNLKSVQTIMQLLKRYRTARPLNGIILTIPLTDLYGSNTPHIDVIHQRALHIGKMISEVERESGLRLPVYIILTKTDIIPGFQNFCARLPGFYKSSMLGWSNPHALDVAFNETHIDEAFESISHALHDLRLEMFASYGDTIHNDGLFVFPKEMQTIYKNLHIYLETIFNPTAFNEGLLLRGLYFTGHGEGAKIITDDVIKTNSSQPFLHQHSHNDIQPISIVNDGPLPEYAINEKTSSINPTYQEGLHAFTKNDDLYVQQQKLHLYFVQDLLNQKIIFEAGLAIPLKRYWSTYQKVTYVKSAVGIGFTISCFGLFNAYHTFTQSRVNIQPALSNMKNVLQETTALQRYGITTNILQSTTEGAAVFSLHTRQIIDMMIQVEKSELRSIFVPASWFSSIDKSLRQSLQIAFREVIIRGIANGLAIKANEILMQRPTQQYRTTNITQLLIPTSSLEFKHVQQYVQDLHHLDLHLSMMQSLKRTGEPSQLKELIAYTFKGNLPDDFWKHYESFRSILRTTRISPLQIDALRGEARKTLGILYENFLNAMFLKSSPYSLPYKLNMLTDMLCDNKPLIQPNIQDLYLLNQYLQPTVQLLGESGKTWFDQPYFNPNEEMTQFFHAIANSRLFGKEVVQFMIDQTAKGFDALKLEMLRISKKIDSISITKSQTPTGQAAPSSIIFDINTILAQIFSQDFMQPLQIIPLTVLVPANKIPTFDPQIIRLAHSMHQQYDTFLTKTLPAFPSNMHQKIKEILSLSLHDTLRSLVTKAQRFDDIPSVFIPEDLQYALQNHAKNFNDISPTILKLLAFLRQKPNDSFAQDWTFLITHLAAFILGQCDKSLQQSNPFAVIDYQFTWWDGNKGASLSGFGVRDTPDLSNYIQQQIKNISQIALDIAKPFVYFLTAQPFDLPQLKNTNNRWHVITQELENYQKRKPGNSVKMLEDFILGDMNQLSASDALKKISISEVHHESIDFFKETQRSLKKAMRCKAEILQRQKSIQSVQTLVRYFNEHLKDQFPFSSSPATAKGQADPNQIRNFFTLYNQAGGSLDVILDQVYQLGDKAFAITQFFKQLDSLKQFFGAYLDSTSGVLVPTFDFFIEFRTNREREKLGEMVANWSFQPNPNMNISKKDSKRNGQWVFNNDVSFQFRWPLGKNALAKPVTDPSQPMLSVKDQTARFNYSGPWALLWALQTHMAPVTESGPKNGSNAILLKFIVPTNSKEKNTQEQAILYNSMTLTLPDNEKKGSGKHLTFPTFPAVAPALDPTIIALARDAVLTEKKVK